MLKKRIGVFETNSSSAHSITIADGISVIDTTLIPNANGTIFLEGGQFGREWVAYNDARTKANYCAVDLFKTDAINLLIEVIKERTKAKEVILQFSTDWNNDNYSFIDHQSQGTAPVTKDELDRFIFSPESWLYTGSDETDAPPEFFIPPNTPMKFRFTCVEFPQITSRFVTKPTQEDIDKVVRSFDIELYLDGNTPLLSMYNISLPYNRVRNLKKFTYGNHRLDDELITDSTILLSVYDVYSQARQYIEEKYKTRDFNQKHYTEMREYEDSLYRLPENKIILHYVIEEVDEVK